MDLNRLGFEDLRLKVLGVLDFVRLRLALLCWTLKHRLCSASYLETPHCIGAFRSHNGMKLVVIIDQLLADFYKYVPVLFFETYAEQGKVGS